jgi:plasmid replication initiation protein
VMLADWLFRAVLSHEVLTLHRQYFRLSGGLERRVYELCRKHCGNQETWSIHLPLLYKKSGSKAPLRRFRYEMKQLATYNMLPDYSISFDPQTDKLTAYPRTHKGGLRQLKDTLGL